MTAEEADARFAALVADYRRDQRGDQRGSGRGRKDTRGPGSPAVSRTSIVIVVAYLAGVGAGAFFHGSLVLPVLLGVIVVVGAHFVLPRNDR